MRIAFPSRILAITIPAAAILFANQSASAATLTALQVTDPKPAGAITLDSDIGTVTINDVVITNKNNVAVTFTDLSAGATPDTSPTQGEQAGASLIPDNSGVDPTCGTILAAGSSCEVDLVLTVTRNTGKSGSTNDNATTITADAIINASINLGTVKNPDIIAAGTALPNETTSSFDTEVHNDGPVPTTPEPSGLILLGTGMLGMAGMVWRKVGRG
jgi:hypothetical protein